MILLLTLLWLCSDAAVRKRDCSPLFYPEGCDSNEVSFRRTSHTANVARQFSVFMHGENSERIQVHAVLVFTHNETEFHNTLLFNARQFAKYSTLVRESEFRFNNEVVLLSRGRRLLLQYDVAAPGHPYFDNYDYDAALLLDPQSSMWHEYNTITTTRSHLSLSYRRSTQTDDTSQHYSGHYTLQCAADERHQCVVQHALTPERFHRQAYTDGGLWVNGRHYPQYRLVLDASSPVNRLPHELYMRWRYHGERVLRLGWTGANSSELRLSGQFLYEAHAHQALNTVLVGSDALRHFGRTERRLANGQFLLYYTADYAATDADSSAGGVALGLTFILLTVVLMWCLTRWYTGQNYAVLHHLLSHSRAKQRRHFEFQHRQLASEMAALAITVVLWILIGCLTPMLSQADFQYGNAVQERKLMLYLFSASQALLCAWFLVRSSDSVRAMLQHYWACVQYHAWLGKDDRGYARARFAATHYTVPMKTEVVLMRNLALHQLLACDLLFIFNYKSDAKTMYMYLIVAVALALLYFYVKYLYMAVYYLYDATHNHGHSRRALWPQHAQLLCYVLLSVVLAAALTGVSVPIVYMDFVQQTNSAFSQVQLAAFVMALLAAVCSVATSSVDTVIMAAVTERVMAPHDRRHARRA